MLASTSVNAVPAPPTHDPRKTYDPSSVLTRPAGLPDVVLRWADHADGVAEVWLPPTGFGAAPEPAPLLYAVHGGFWRQRYDRRHLRPLAQALCGLGWAVVVPEYARIGGRHRAAGLDAPWPLLADDLRTLRRLVPQMLAEVAPGRITADRPVLVGHSAGGLLALWWALDARGGREGPLSQPRHVLALAPVADLARARAERLGDGAVAALLGSDTAPSAAVSGPDIAARLRAGEHPEECSLHVLHGTDDVQVPVVHSTDLAADASALDVRVLPDVEHFALIDPLSAAWPDVAAALPPLVSTPPPPRPAAT